MKKRKNQREMSLLILCLILLAVAINFIRENWKTIVVVLYVVGGILFLGIASFITIKLVNRKKKERAYKKTPYFQETGVPYSTKLEERGVKFEIDCYNNIRQTVGPNYPMLTDLLIPQYNAINKDSQIDLILFHSNGVYVIEMKNYSGPLIGSVEDDRWVPYLEKRRKGKKGNFEDFFEKNWALFDHAAGIWKPLNPIKQNQKHIETLQKLYPSQYKNIVILSDSMFVSLDSTKSMIENVMSLSDFTKLLQNEEPIYSLEELQELYQNIKAIDRQSDPKAKLLHIARVKSIEQSQKRKH